MHPVMEPNEIPKEVKDGVLKYSWTISDQGRSDNSTQPSTTALYSTQTSAPIITLWLRSVSKFLNKLAYRLGNFRRYSASHRSKTFLSFA
jgi:hypothetical protein